MLSGQSQKEFFLNQSLVAIDALLPKAVQGVLEAPPEVASIGESFLVGSSPSDDWLDKPGYLAIRMGEGWHFVAPAEGMEVFDTATGRKLIYLTEWYQPVAPIEPTGGSIVDAEARSAISDLIAALQSMKLLG